MAKPVQALRAAFDGNAKNMADALTGRGVKQAANRADSAGRGTLTCAVAGKTGDEQASHCVKLLLRAGAEVNMADKHNQTALHFAARFGRPLCAIALIDAGTDADIATEAGMRPIHLALLAANPQLVHELIRAGADIESPGSPGKTPLDFAQEMIEKPDSANSISSPKTFEFNARRREAVNLLELHLFTRAGKAPRRRPSL